MNRSARGFTLYELMIVVALAAVVMGLGVPAFQDLARNGRLTGAANDLLMAVIATRNEAMRQQGTASLCPSANPTAGAAAACSGASLTGYIAFVDANGNCTRDAGEEVVASISLHSRVRAGKNMTCVSFGANGFRRVVAGQPATARAVFCDDRGVTEIGTAADISFARGLEVLPTGRAYVSRTQSELEAWAAGADPVSCS